MSSSFGGDRDALAALNQDFTLDFAVASRVASRVATLSAASSVAHAPDANPLVDELNAGFLASNMSAPRRDRPPSSRVGADHAAPAQPNANPLIDELNAGFLGSSTPSPPRRRRRQEPAPQAAPPVPAVTPAVQPPAQPPAQPRGPRGNYNVAERGNADPERARQRFIQRFNTSAELLIPEGDIPTVDGTDVFSQPSAPATGFHAEQLKLYQSFVDKLKSVGEKGCCVCQELVPTDEVMEQHPGERRLSATRINSSKWLPLPSTPSAPRPPPKRTTLPQTAPRPPTKRKALATD